MERISKPLIIFVATFIFFGVFSPKTYSQTPGIPTTEEMSLGTMCPLNADPRLSNICGTLRAAMPKDVITSDGDTLPSTGLPLSGVSVYLYECDPNSPTCKSSGNLTNRFSSTWSDNEGQFMIASRKIGGNYRRYLVFACGGKLASLKKIPSYANLEIHELLDCPEFNSYREPPINMSYNNDLVPLACDMEEAIPGNASSLAIEVGYDESKPQTTMNFMLELNNADARFVMPANDPLGGTFANAGNQEGPGRGAFWSLDCLLQYRDTNSLNMCIGGDTNESDDGELQWGFRTVNEYRDALETQPYILIQNKLANIPPKSTVLYYKEFTARQDMTEYAQNPTKGAQFLLTHFSNCAGKVYLRDRLEPLSNEVIDCEEFKKCNEAATFDTSDGNYRNRQYSGGYMSGLANPYILQNTYNMDLIPALTNVVVCKSNGEEIMISDIQPWWSNCRVGNGDCPYRLSKSYFLNELTYFYGMKGATPKIGTSFESRNDSYSTNDETAANTTAFMPSWEAAGQPAKGGTFRVIPNGTFNNSPAAALGGIISSDFSNNSQNLGYVLQHPFMEDRSLFAGGLKIWDKDVERAHCIKSNVNDPVDVALNVGNEAEVMPITNDLFRGRQDHWFEEATSTLWNGQMTDNSESANHKRSATSARFFTSAADIRTRYLQSRNTAQWSGIIPLPTLYLLSRDFYDSYHTSSMGTGNIEPVNTNLLAAITQYISSFIVGQFTDIGDSENKSYYDRKSSIGTPAPLDDLHVDYELNEENFKSFFPLPSDRFTPNQPFPLLRPTDWGEHPCYPWYPVLMNGRCERAKEPPSNISRTCRVDLCRAAYARATCRCNINVWGEAEGDCSRDSIEITESGACSAGQVIKCAQNQTTCLAEGERNGRPIALDTEDSRQCLQDNYANDEWLEGLNESECPATDDTRYYADDTGWCTELNGYSPDGIHCPITVHVTDPIPNCQVSKAGPYTCVGNVEKDANLRVRSEFIRNDTGLHLDPMVIADNEALKMLQRPFYQYVSHFPSADVSTKTSTVTQDTELTNQTRTKNKDIAGYGSGASSEYRMIAAHPTIFNKEPDYNPTIFHCESAELGTTGEWECPLLPVPDPEVVDISSLEVDGSCRINLSGPCIAALAEAGVDHTDFNETFLQILGAGSTAFHVPPSVALAYMSFIQTLGSSSYRYFWLRGGESLLLQGSAPWYGVLGACDEEDTSADSNAYHFIAEYFYAIKGDTGSSTPLRQALDEISDGRGETASKCNFLDATYAISSAFSNGGVIGENDCSSWNWDLAQLQLYTVAYGSSPMGNNRTVEFLEDGGTAERIFESCKVN